ncbi:putative fatty acyl-CoA reductase CG5065 isoform 2-T3 [Cochliomyia hominivorax]
MKMGITDFFANREIFVTGATGFLGKSLIEKLLRDIPIKVLYVLIRGKKTLTAEQRLEQLKEDKVFDLIREKCPEVLNKLHAIQGDGKEVGLGIKPSDLELMKNVSMIFHIAANVKFDDPLKSSILLNTRCTYELVKIAEKLKNLVVFTHCSTGFCNPFNHVVEEKVYKMPVDWRKTIQIAETFDEYTINALCAKYTGFYPNTYTFTKNLSEQIIEEYSSKLPMIIFRPTVVTSAHKEPFPGWADNINGGQSGCVGSGIGIFPAFYGNGNMYVDFVPIDMVTNLTIVAAYKRAIQVTSKTNHPNGLDVINCAATDDLKINLSASLDLAIRSFKLNPMENCIWSYDSISATTCYYNFLIQILMTNIPLALIIDNILRFKGHKTIIMRTTRRIVYAFKAISFFSLREYEWKKENMLDLLNWIPENEVKKMHTILQDEDRDYFIYFDNLAKGIKYFLFNQSPQASESTLKRHKIMTFVNQIVKFVLFSTIVAFLWLTVSKT